MTREQNVFLAKKLFAELVYNTAYIEGVNVTFPQTQTIIDGGVVNNIAVDDIQTVLNLRDAWKYVLATLDTPISLAYICEINGFVSRNESLAWGKLRTGTVGISGTDYEPPVPDEAGVQEALEKISSIKDPLERATEYFCYAVRGQLFWDGNKRTSTIVASKILIEAGAGVLTIDAKHAQRFNEALLNLYDTGEKSPLQAVLADCVKTMEPVKQKQQPEEPER